MKFLYLFYTLFIVIGATALNYRQADDYDDSTGSGSGSRHGSGFFGSSHK